MKVLVLQGPNLNRLGKRLPEVYGTTTLPQVEARMDESARRSAIELEHFQSNHEGSLIDWLQERQERADGLMLNPGGITNYGRSLRDALQESGKPVAIVHLSNPLGREPWRREDVFAEIASIYIAGAGWMGYLLALEALIHLINTTV